jgi:hypothetical protein
MVVHLGYVILTEAIQRGKVQPGKEFKYQLSATLDLKIAVDPASLGEVL